MARFGLGKYLCSDENAAGDADLLATSFQNYAIIVAPV
jgi:hypothetical protein